MSTKSRYRGANLEFYESTTHERVLPVAPVVFYDDFLGTDLMTTESGSTGPWSTVEVALNTAIGVRADTANGVCALIFDSDVNASDAVLYWGDQKGINVNAGAIFETRINMAVVPGTGVVAVFGLAGDHNLAKDSVTEGAWFRLQASAVVVAETDDTTNNNDDIATGVTMVAGTYNTFRIDFTDISNVLFYIDGAAVATATTFDMSNLTAGEAIMQPYFSLDKASAASLGTLDIDYVRIWSNRS